MTSTSNLVMKTTRFPDALVGRLPTANKLSAFSAGVSPYTRSPIIGSVTGVLFILIWKSVHQELQDLLLHCCMVSRAGKSCSEILFWLLGWEMDVASPWLEDLASTSTIAWFLLPFGMAMIKSLQEIPFPQSSRLLMYGFFNEMDKKGKLLKSLITYKCPKFYNNLKELQF